jgi:hypothetical protein
MTRAERIAEALTLAFMVAVLVLLCLVGGCACHREHACGWDLWRDIDGRMVAHEPEYVRCGEHRPQGPPTHELVAVGGRVSLVAIGAEAWR